MYPVHRSIPRLVDRVHITHPDINEVVQGSVIQRHVVSMTIQLVLMESNKAPMINQVVHRQPLLQDVLEVLFWVLRPKESRIHNLQPVTTTLTR